MRVYALCSMLCALIVVALMFSFINISCAQREGVGTRDKAPDFTLKDINGQEVTLSEVVKANESVLLVFWTTWCLFCREEVPQIRRLNADYKGKGLKILAINIGETKKRVESFVKQEGIDYTVLLDTDNVVASQYGVMGIPTNILIGKDENIKYRGTRPPPEDLLPQR